MIQGMATTAALQISQLFIARSWRALFVVMLVSLHLASMWGTEDYWARGLMLAHFGLFILWQPFMRGEHRLTSAQVAAIATVALGTLYFLNWWLLALWVSVLAGIVGGKVFLFQARWLRRFYLVVLLYLVSLLLIWIVPNTFRVPLPNEVELLAQYGLPLLFLMMIAIPAETDSAETPQVVDFFYAAMIVLLLIALALGSFTFMTVGRIDYIMALSYSMLIIAGVLLLLSFAWNPRAGFSGLSIYFSRYLLSIGLPFERWLYFLAEKYTESPRSEEHTSELQSRSDLVCRLLLAKKNTSEFQSRSDLVCGLVPVKKTAALWRATASTTLVRIRRGAYTEILRGSSHA